MSGFGCTECDEFMCECFLCVPSTTKPSIQQSIKKKTHHSNHPRDSHPNNNPPTPILHPLHLLRQPPLLLRLRHPLLLRPPLHRASLLRMLRIPPHERLHRARLHRHRASQSHRHPDARDQKLRRQGECVCKLLPRTGVYEPGCCADG